MTQPNQRVRTINLNEKKFQFQFSTFALAALQDLWKTKSLDDTLAQLTRLEVAPIETLPDVIWAGFRRWHPEVTHAEVVLMIEDHGVAKIPALVNEIVAVCQASLPQGQGKRPINRGNRNSGN